MKFKLSLIAFSAEAGADGKSNLVSLKKDRRFGP